MENLENIEKDNSYKIFKILFDFYLFGKKIEKINTELMLNEEYFFINLNWLKTFKEKFNFKNLENTLNINFEFDHTFDFGQLKNKHYLPSIYQTLKLRYNYQLQVTEEDLKSVNIIRNQNIEKKEQDFIAQKDFAIISKFIINDLKDNGFVFDSYPKFDIYIGNHNIIFENMDKYLKNCLQCIIFDDYDSFTNEYIIKYTNNKCLAEHRNLITSKTLKYYFDENKINMEKYEEQIIYDLQKNEIATVFNLNKDNLKQKYLLLKQTMLKFNNSNIVSDQFQKNNYFPNKNINEVEKNGINNLILINNSSNNIIQNGNYSPMTFDYIGGGNMVNNQIPDNSQNNIAKKTNYLQNIQIKDFGLKNFGNSCYINAVLQCIIHTRQIAVYFIKKNNNFDQNVMPLSFFFNSLLKSFYIPKNYNYNNNNDITNKLYWLCQFIFILNNNFSALLPNDAKDFLIFFIGRLHAELNEENEQAFNIVNQKDPLKNFISYFTRNHNSIISNIYNWTNQIKRKCSNCNAQILSYQTFPYLILDLEKTRKKLFMSDLNIYHKSKINNENWQNEYYRNKENIPINLIDCIKYYTSYQNDFNFLCPMCNLTCKQTTINTIYSSPNIFIFILNRGKNNIFSVKMNYPPELDLSKYIEALNCPTKYELTGVITHLGVSGPNGHFIAFCKNPINGKWYKYNDDQVTEADNYNVHNDGIAYILFYNCLKSKTNNI